MDWFLVSAFLYLMGALFTGGVCLLHESQAKEPPLIVFIRIVFWPLVVLLSFMVALVGVRKK